MGLDDQAIREMHSTWIDAVNAGDLVCLLSSTAQRNWPYPASPVLLTCQPSMTGNPFLAGREATRDQEGSATGVAALYSVRAPLWSATGRRHAGGSGGSLPAWPAARRG